MKNNLSTLFYLKKPKNYITGQVPIYMRITVNGARKDFYSGKTCDPSQWNAKANRMTGSRQEVKSFNGYLFALEKRIDQIHSDLTTEGKDSTALTIMNRYLKLDQEVEKPRMLIEVFKDHNDKVEALIGVDFRRPTLSKYNTTLKHLENFLIYKFKVNNYFGEPNLSGV